MMATAAAHLARGLTDILQAIAPAFGDRERAWVGPAWEALPAARRRLLVAACEALLAEGTCHCEGSP